MLIGWLVLYMHQGASSRKPCDSAGGRPAHDLVLWPFRVYSLVAPGL